MATAIYMRINGHSHLHADKIDIKNQLHLQLQMNLNDDKVKQLYLESLDLLQKIAYEIAVNHLTESYTLEKSNGFLKFKKEYEAKHPPSTK